MSKVVANSQLLSPFESTQQTDITPRRKRSFSSIPVEQVKETPNKRTKTKRTVKESTETSFSVWIGATVLEKKESVAAAFSVFYGPADDRNYTKKLQFEKKQALIDVLLMGVLDVLKLHESTSDVLLVHVGSGNQEEYITKCELYDQVKQLIEKRKAKTLIVYATDQQVNSEWEHLQANQSAKEAIAEQIDKKEAESSDAVMADVEIEADEKKDEETNIADGVVPDVKEEVDVTCDKQEETSVDINVVSSVDAVEETSEESATLDLPEQVKEQPPSADQIESSGWGFKFSFRNLVDVLKAPFNRK
ncbi:hypothetical protein G6F70_001566 [Rhizopus microsporus]|uniref:Uncharacterized protein n=1 Tax=Rhizopus microsporus TaxID=58291 RepID=A0A1X0S8W8_RHIZD|nr:hypothetical protein G6F71_001835 [Rhizopus microsporus]KAG1203268.1 hypothetical protein G6F70_001566 [Rhizopus microsporus]KAG1216368.1 hypothetical protein G6F69_000130 [Rhizopus microsporus]KAG1238375.1 hypothetical protein G6F67_000462 [Rhizopus microsporus]KAG1269012.1 hypothetical protein G6F68_000647 [Rhizopus microsporus]